MLLSENFTYKEFHKNIQNWRLKLQECGISEGMTVALQVHASFTYLAVIYSIWKIGATVVLIDTRLKDAEREEILSLSKPHFIIKSEHKRSAFVTFKAEESVLIEQLEGGINLSAECALIQFTSGSTGKPKIVGRSVTSLLDELQRLRTAEGCLKGTDRVLVLSSISHTYGFITGVMQALSEGAALVFPASVQAAAVMDMIVKHNVTCVFGVPFHFEMLAASEVEQSLPSIRMAVSAGEILTTSLREAFFRKFGLHIGQVYGMTEVGIITADYLSKHSNSVGVLLKGITLQVKHDEIYIKLPQTPYLLSDDSCRYSDGWLQTCDVGHIDHERNILRVIGRSDALVIIGGLKVNLGEIEAIIKKHSLVQEVRVICNEHKEIEAYISSCKDLYVKDLLFWCKQNIADYKIPKVFYLSSTLPKTTTGKLIRNRLNLLENAQKYPLHS